MTDKILHSVYFVLLLLLCFGPRPEQNEACARRPSAAIATYIYLMRPWAAHGTKEKHAAILLYPK